MPGYTVTRGFGGKPTNVILRGFNTDKILRILKGGASKARQLVADITEKFVISAMLISSNGKEYTAPIISTVQRVFDPEESIKVSANPKSLSTKKSNSPRVTAKITNVRKRNE